MADVINLALFGRMNVGKSSLINMMLGYDFSIVSPVAGTTTDAVRKRFEMPGVGMVNLIDSAGYNDLDSSLGEKRTARTLDLVKQIDYAVLLYSGNQFGDYEKKMVRYFKDYDIPFVVVHNQSDIIPMDAALAEKIEKKYAVKVLEFSCDVIDEAERKTLLDRLYEALAELIRPCAVRTILQGLVGEGDLIWLVCPIDESAPEGRLILPQVMAIRDVLDHKGRALVCQPEQLPSMLGGSAEKPSLVVVDSQVFGKVRDLIPEDYPLTSFSILLARSKGPFEEYLEGIGQIARLQDGDRVLILESCSHHASCNDIGRVKIPTLLKKKTGKALEFDVVSSLGAIDDFAKYQLVIQCGACMITRKQLMSRLKEPMDRRIPITNYGMTLAYLSGILERAVAPLK